MIFLMKMVRMAADMVATSDLPKVNLFDLHHKYADVMHVEDIVAHFLSKKG